MVGDYQGNMWVGTRNQGLCRVSGSKFSCWSTKDGLADDFVRSLYEDDEHNLWVGLSSGGLARWRIATLIPLRDEPRAAARGAARCDPSGSQRISSGLGPGVADCSGLNRDDFYANFRREIPSAIRTLEEDAAGNVWIGTWFNGLFRYNGAGFKQILLGRETLTDAVSALLSDKNGGFWVGTYTGLLHYADGVPAKDKGVLLLKDKLITCLAQNDDGSILVGTSAGLYRVVGDKVRMVEGLSHPYVLSISIDNARNVWVGTKGGGLDWLKGDHPVHLDTTNGMVDYTVFSVLDDGQGFLWMATSRGIVRVQRQQLEELAAQKRKTLDYVLLGKADGMPSSECLGVAQPHSTRAKDGTLWFATAKGLVHTDPDGAVPPAAHPAELTGALLDDASVHVNNRLELSPGLEDLVFQFNSQNLANPAQMEFRYKLDGYDRDWTVTRSRGRTLSKTSSRSLSFSGGRAQCGFGMER